MGSSVCCVTGEDASEVSLIPAARLTVEEDVSHEKGLDIVGENVSAPELNANEVQASLWTVVYKMRFPVHSDKSTDAQFLGTKKPGDVVRGIQNGDWLVLVDEPGCMRICAVGSGKRVLQQVGVAVEAEPINEGEVASWKVVYKMRFPVNTAKSTEASFVGTKKPGEIVRGIQDGDWLMLVDEPGFMRIAAVGTGKQVLEKVEDGAQATAVPGLELPLAEEPASAPAVEEDEEEEAAAAPVMAQVLQGSFCVTIQKGSEEKLGLCACSCSWEGQRALKIKKVKDGLVKQWNIDNPVRALCEGDVIIEVNGVNGNSEELYGVIASDKVLNFVIIRNVLDS